MDAVTPLLLGMLNLVLPALQGLVNAVSNRVWGGLTDLFTFIGVPAVTLWILINGYMILTGATREPLGSFLLKAGKVYFWMLLATGSAAFNGDLRQLTVDLRDASTEMVTGSGAPFWSQIQTQVGLMSVTAGIVGLTAQNMRERNEPDGAATVATVGSTLAVAMPIVVVGMTGLTLEAAMTIGAAFAPMFFFMGIFQKFADWPVMWVKYMLGIVLTASVMAAMSVWAMGVYVASLVASVGLVATGAGLLQVSTVMAASGVLMTGLIITIPSLVSRLFGQMSVGAANNQLGGMTDASPAAKSKSKPEDSKPKKQ